MLWIGWKGRGSPGRAVWPVWLLLAATVFAAGFKIGLNVRASNVIDVGFAGVIGAQRIVDQGEAPYGHMPDDEGKECGEPDSTATSASGSRRTVVASRRTAVQTRTGPSRTRCTSPGIYVWLEKVGRFACCALHVDPLRHARADWTRARRTAVRRRPPRRHAGLRLGRLSLHPVRPAPTRTTRSCRRSSSWGFWLWTAAPARGAFLALGAWTKFAALVLVPLWAGYPLALGRRGLRSVGLFAAGFAAATPRVLDPVPRAEPTQRRRDVLGTARSPGSSTVRRRSRSGTGTSTRASRPARPAGALKIAPSQARLRSASSPCPDAAQARRAHRRRPDCLRARPDALAFYLYIPWFFLFVAIGGAGPARAATGGAASGASA